MKKVIFVLALVVLFSFWNLFAGTIVQQKDFSGIPAYTDTLTFWGFQHYVATGYTPTLDNVNVYVILTSHDYSMKLDNDAATSSSATCGFGSNGYLSATVSLTNTAGYAIGGALNSYTENAYNLASNTSDPTGQYNWDGEADNVAFGGAGTTASDTDNGDIHSAFRSQYDIDSTYDITIHTNQYWDVGGVGGVWFEGGSGNADGYVKVIYTYTGTLPVELSTFTAEYLNNMAVLHWVTQSETDNIGWNVYRNNEEEFQSATQINNDLISGYVTTTEPHSYIYEDEIENATVGDTYWYWLESTDLGGQSHIYQIASSIEIPDPDDPGYNVEVPVLYGLQNAPNPFNSYTKIHYTLSEPAIVEVSIYNILGKLVRTLPKDLAVQDGEAYIGTSHWDGKDASGNLTRSGIYFYQLNVNGKAGATKKLILMR